MKLSVGVDIGSTEVRVAVVRGIDTDGFAAVARSGVVPLREGAVVHGQIRNHLVTSQALVRALEMAGVPRYGFILGYSAPDIAVARRVVPAAVRPSERVKALRTVDQQISPTLSLSDAVLSTNEVSIDYTGDRRAVTTLTVAAIPKAQIESMRKLMVLAGCEPRAIDLAAAGTMRALVRVPPDSTEVHTIVDIGETTVTIATRQGPHLRSVRIMPVGGLTITRAIMAETGDDASKAVERRQMLHLTPESDNFPISLPGPYGSLSAPTITTSSNVSSFEEAVNRAANEIIDAIAVAIENDASNFSNTLTQGVVLTGRTSQISGLRNLVNQRLGVPVQLGRPWARLEKTRFNLPYILPEQTTPHLMNLTTAVGLALWRDPS